MEIETLQEKKGITNFNKLMQLVIIWAFLNQGVDIHCTRILIHTTNLCLKKNILLI